MDIKNNALAKTARAYAGGGFGKRAAKDFKRNYSLYLIALPVLLFYILFAYKPMYGVWIAFTRFNPAQGIVGSPWVGLANFTSFFRSHYFARLMKNTLFISAASILFSIPSAVLLALLINEVKSKAFAKTVQTITYMPHFISLVVVCGIVADFVSLDGLVNKILALFGAEAVSFLQMPEYFVPIYIISDLWQEVGWSSIIYLAAIVGIDAELYEAATIDGAGRVRQVLHITLPGILPTVVIMLLLRLGAIMNVGFEKIILLYNPMIYDTSDVISTYVYRAGLENFDFGLSAAVGLFNSVINFALILISNTLCRKLNETSLW
ncbi:MAG: ABC transporter permease subunit [Clostridiales bacterium]|jgi:putative aldouronate transport system permease protein|nr:ABC transporter permease subunit [Clostridiales bacterium]